MLLLNHTVDIHRPQALGTNGRKAMQLLTPNVACLGLPVGAQTAIQNNLQLGRAYQFNFAEGTDVKQGDRLIWNGTNMSVKFVRPYLNTSPVSHLEAMCEQEIG